MKPLLVALGLTVALPAPAVASSHCGAILDTAQLVFETLSSGTTENAAPEICEPELEAARDLMQQGREQAEACGCDAMAESFDAMIEQSRSSDYECWNIRQGIRSTILSSVGDSVEIYCHGG